MNRSTFLRNLIGLYGIASLPLQNVKQFQKVYLLQCFVRGFQYYEGPKIIKKINKSGLVELVREPDNSYDSNAIAIYFNQLKIGFIPRESNELLSTLLDTELLQLQAEITHIEPDAHDWEKIHVAIYALKEIKDNNDAEKTAAFSTVQKPYYHTLKSSKDTYTRIYFDEYDNQDEILDADDFYDALVKNSKTDAVYDLIHTSFPHPDDMEEAVNESLLVIDKNKIPASVSLQNIAEHVNDAILKIEDTFDEDGYIVANINKIATLPDKIERFEKIISKSGQHFYEVVFKNKV